MTATAVSTIFAMKSHIASTAWLYEMRARRVRTCCYLKACHADAEDHQGVKTSKAVTTQGHEKPLAML